eukprot:86770_1
MAHHLISFETTGSGGEVEDETTIILQNNQLSYLLPIFQEARTNFDELITFDDEMLDDWFGEINSKFRNKFDKIRLKKAIKNHRKSKQSSPSSPIKLKQSTIHSVQIITIDTETTHFCNQLNDHIDKTNHAITNLETSVHTLTDIQQSKRDYLEQKCEQMIHTINELKRNTLIPNVDTICTNKLDILQQQMKSFQTYLELLNHTKQKVDKSLRDLSLTNETRKQCIVTPIKQTINPNLSFHPNTSLFVDVTFNASRFAQDLEHYWVISGVGKPFHERIQWLECGSGTTDILLTWRIPNASKEVLESIDGYIIYHCEDDGKQCDDVDISDFIQHKIEDATSPTSHSLMNLDESTTYRVLICSYNKVGASPLSEVLTVQTNDTLVIQPRIDQQQLQNQLPPIDEVQKLFATLRSKKNISDTLFDIFIRVDRSLFVPAKQKKRCNAKDAPIDINYGVSLSAPHIHIHALTQFEYLLQPPYTERGIKFLDVGCGSGYIANLMAVAILFNTNINKLNVSFKSFGSVYHEDLLVQAQHACQAMHLENILSFHQGDTDASHIGLKEHAPFDGIYCGAAIPKHDANLLRTQLKIGGQLMCVVETERNEQVMQLVKRTSKTSYRETQLFAVRFRTLRGRFPFL